MKAASDLAITPTHRLCVQNSSGEKTEKDPLLLKFSRIAKLKARFLTVFSPSMTIARVREVIGTPGE
jgi:hypothetical protein